jgi:hypothetical protein
MLLLLLLAQQLAHLSVACIAQLDVFDAEGQALLVDGRNLQQQQQQQGRHALDQAQRSPCNQEESCTTAMLSGAGIFAKACTMA